MGITVTYLNLNWSYLNNTPHIIYHHVWTTLIWPTKITSVFSGKDVFLITRHCLECITNTIMCYLGLHIAHGIYRPWLCNLHVLALSLYMVHNNVHTLRLSFYFVHTWVNPCTLAALFIVLARLAMERVDEKLNRNLNTLTKNFLCS